MMSLAVLLLCAVSGHTLGSTLKPLQEKNMEYAVFDLTKQMSNVEEKILILEKKEWVEEIRKMKDELSTEIKDKLLMEIKDKLLIEIKDELSMEIKEEVLLEIKSSEQRFVENKNELASKLEQVLARMSEIEKSSNVAIDDVSDRLQVGENKLVLMNNNLSAEVHELQKRDLDTFEKIANVESELSRDRVRADLFQVQLIKTANMTHSCLASQTQIRETVQKNIERLDVIEESNLSARIGNVENSFKTLGQDLDYVSNRQDDTLKLTVQNNTNDIGELKQELSRIQRICNPPCENGGQCVKNVCNCSSFFTGDRCQQTVCSPPCENGGQCMRNNICKCTFTFYGDRCQNGTKCGVAFDNGGSNGREIISSVIVWPWTAAVYKNYTSGPEHRCGGSVIHRHFVLTSALCVDSYGSGRLSVKLGFSDLKIGTHLQEYRVRSAYKHPEFKLLTTAFFDYDIALLELEEPISFGPFVRPVCLPPPEIPQDELLYKPQSTAKAVRLYEYVSSPQTASPTVLNYTIRPQEECRRKIKEEEWEKYYPSPGLSFCAESSSTTCPERGSPLMQSRLAGDGVRTWTQVGFKSNCADKYLFSPRLIRLMEWVEATIAASSKR